MATILIVDDSPTIRRMVRVSLERLPGLQFREASTGLDAIESLVVSSADLVVLDLNMPDMHGLDVLQFVREQEAFKRLPIVVLTTVSDEASRAAVLARGATRFLTKPFAPDVLAREVGALLDNPSIAAPSYRTGERG